MSQLDMFPRLPRRLSHDEILAGFAQLLRAVEAMEFWKPVTPHEHAITECTHTP